MSWRPRHREQYLPARRSLGQYSRRGRTRSIGHRTAGLPKLHQGRMLTRSEPVSCTATCHRHRSTSSHLSDASSSPNLTHWLRHVAYMPNLVCLHAATYQRSRLMASRGTTLLWRNVSSIMRDFCALSASKIIKGLTVTAYSAHRWIGTFARACLRIGHTANGFG